VIPVQSDSSWAAERMDLTHQLSFESAKWQQQTFGESLVYFHHWTFKKVTGIQEHTINVEVASSTEDTRVRGNPDRTRPAK
jgi:hypothetical protein